MALPNGLRDPLPQPAPFPFGPSSISEIFDEGLRDFPDRLALIDGEQTWTWRGLHDAVADAAEGLPVGEIQGAPRGNSAELVITALAIMHAGGVWAANPPEDGPEARALHDWFWRDPGDEPAPPNGPAALAFTSGTTGTPKAVLHSEHSLLLPALVSADVEPPAPNERIGTPLDLSIANVFVLGPISALVRGSTFVVMKRRYVSALVEDIAAYGVTRLFAVPTMVHDLIELSDAEPELRTQLRSLDRIILGGSGANPATIATFTEAFGLRPTLSYGLSEAPTGVVRESLDDPIGSRRGFPLPHVEPIVIDPETGGELPVGSVGEICLLPARTGKWAGVWTGTLGYLNQPDRTEDLFHGSRMHTGDLGSIDADGAVSVTGRIGNLIVRGGKNIDPTEVERDAKQMRGVVDAVAVGVPDDRLGHIVGLAIVVEPELDELDTAEIVMAFDDVQLCDAMVIVEDLPRNAMGKVLRNNLIPLFTPH